MSQIDYAAMSEQELRQYFLEHDEDQAALQADLERRRERSSQTITTVDDPEFNLKIQAAICQQMSQHQGDAAV